MFAGWKQKAGVPICMQWTSLSNSGWKQCNVQCTAHHTEQLRHIGVWR
jgi:hypothetical protein